MPHANRSTQDVTPNTVTGGAQGIGASTVSQLYGSGAHVFFGDWDDKKGSKLAEDLTASGGSSSGSATYLKVNVREYQSLLSLFDAAYNKHGQIDLAICCAAVTERPGYWEPNKLNLESVREVRQYQVPCYWRFLTEGRHPPASRT